MDFLRELEMNDEKLKTEIAKIIWSNYCICIALFISARFIGLPWNFGWFVLFVFVFGCIHVFTDTEYYFRETEESPQ